MAVDKRDTESGLRQGVRDVAGALVPLSLRGAQRELEKRLRKVPNQLNEYGFDPYGMSPDWIARSSLPGLLLYKYWFRTEVFDIDRVPVGPVLLIANHAGQLPFDGAMLTMAMLLEAEPPRVVRGMGEYFLPRLPFLGVSVSRGGTLVGTPKNCARMLENGECVMVFPEGARGANKPFHKRYQLQRFGQGFMRLALATDTPIVPVGFVGSEEQQPGLANLEDVGHALNLPSLPITISMPWLGIFGPMFALPTKYRIHFGEPLYFEGDSNEEDDAIQERVDVVKGAMAELLARGRAERTGIFT